MALLGGLAALAGAPALVGHAAGLPAWFLLSVIVDRRGRRGLPFASATLEPPWNAVAAAAPRRRSPASSPADGWPRRTVASGAGGRRRERALDGEPRAADPRSGPSRRRRGRPGAALTALALVAAHRPDGAGADHRPRRRAGRRDPRRGRPRRAAARRRRAGPRPPPRRARPAPAAVGSPPRRARPDPPPRGPRRGARDAPRAVPRRAGLRAGHARARAGLRRVGRARSTGRRAAARDPRDRRPAGRRRPPLRRSGRIRGRVPREPPDSGRGINDVSIVLLGEVDGRRVLLTGDVEDDVDPILRPAACRGSTSSRSPTTAAARPRPWPSSASCGRRWRSCRPGRTTRTAIRRSRRSTTSARPARPCSGRIRTARSR